MASTKTADERWDYYEITFSLADGHGMDDALALYEQFDANPIVKGAILSGGNHDAVRGRDEMGLIHCASCQRGAVEYIPFADAERLARMVSEYANNPFMPDRLRRALAEYLSKHPWSEL